MLFKLFLQMAAIKMFWDVSLWRRRGCLWKRRSWPPSWDRWRRRGGSITL